MANAYWESKNEIKKSLSKVNIKDNIDNSGVPILYEGENCYVTKNHAHSLVIGATGSGKTQTIILPLVKLSMLAGESIIVNDVKGEIYKYTAKEFKKRGYNVLMLDFNDAIYGNYWNPLYFPYKIYQNGNCDKALNLIENIGHYLFCDNQKNDMDPFWINSTIDYFTGLCLYLFKEKKDEVNINDVFDLANQLLDDKKRNDFLNKIGKNNTIYYNVSGTLESPADTRGGIISTFKQKIKKFISREKLSEMISKSDFEIEKISSEKTVIFIVSGYYDFSNNLIPLFINQVFEAVNMFESKDKYINIILDEFDRLVPIKDFTEIINYSRSLRINFTVVIKSYLDLINTYGKENAELIKLCFGNYIYLYANDIYTMQEFSKLCGNKSDINNLPLITVEELKSLEQFEAIFLLPRLMPYKGKLVPDYMINWNYTKDEANYIERKKDIS